MDGQVRVKRLGCPVMPSFGESLPYRKLDFYGEDVLDMREAVMPKERMYSKELPSQTFEFLKNVRMQLNPEAREDWLSWSIVCHRLI